MVGHSLARMETCFGGDPDRRVLRSDRKPLAESSGCAILIYNSVKQSSLVMHGDIYINGEI